MGYMHSCFCTVYVPDLATLIYTLLLLKFGSEECSAVYALTTEGVYLTKDYLKSLCLSGFLRKQGRFMSDIPRGHLFIQHSYIKHRDNYRGLYWQWVLRRNYFCTHKVVKGFDTETHTHVAYTETHAQPREYVHTVNTYIHTVVHEGLIGEVKSLIPVLRPCSSPLWAGLL